MEDKLNAILNAIGHIDQRIDKIDGRIDKIDGQIGG
jgi:hypothetical protein